MPYFMNIFSLQFEHFFINPSFEFFIQVICCLCVGLSLKQIFIDGRMTKMPYFLTKQ